HRSARRGRRAASATGADADHQIRRRATQHQSAAAHRYADRSGVLQTWRHSAVRTPGAVGCLRPLTSPRCLAQRGDLAIGTGKQKGRRIATAFFNECRFRRLLGGGTDVRGLLALRSRRHFEIDTLIFFETLESPARDSGKMGEQVFAATVRGDESVALLVVEPFDDTGCHTYHSCVLMYYLAFTKRAFAHVQGLQGV